MKNIFVWLVLLCLLVVSAAVADDAKKGDEDKTACCPLGKFADVYLMIEGKMSDADVKTFVNDMKRSCHGRLSTLKCKVINDKDDADALEGGFLLQVNIERSAELRRSYSHWTTWSDLFYGKYRLSESRDGKWKKAGAGKLRISNLRSHEEYLAWIILGEMISVKVKNVRNSSDGKCKVYGVLKNNTDLRFNIVSVLAPLKTDTPFVSDVKVFEATEVLEPGEKRSFTVEVPQQFTGTVGSGSSSSTTARADIVWKKAYVATVGKILAPEKKQE